MPSFAAKVSLIGIALVAGSLAQACDSRTNPDCLGSGTNEWFLNFGGVSRHARDTASRGRHWNEVNPSLGIELRRPGLPWEPGERSGPWRTSYAAGLFVDSRDRHSEYGAAAITYELATIGRTRIDGGAGAFLFHRSASWNGRMHWTPALLPVLQLTDMRNGLGFEIVWRPPGTGGPSTIALQITMRIGGSAAEVSGNWFGRPNVATRI